MENKYIYIDESNISINTGHSVYCAVFIFFKDKDLLNKQIVFIEYKLNIKYLHWVDLSWKSRVKFAENINNLNFTCRFLIYKNPINQESILEDFISEIVNVDDNILKILIDGTKNKKYIQKLKKKIKHRGIIFNKLIFIDDKSEALIRLTDFMTGLIRSYTDNRNQHNEYMVNILKDKIKIPD